MNQAPNTPNNLCKNVINAVSIIMSGEFTDITNRGSANDNNFLPKQMSANDETDPFDESSTAKNVIDFFNYFRGAPPMQNSRPTASVV